MLPLKQDEAQESWRKDNPYSSSGGSEEDQFELGNLSSVIESIPLSARVNGREN